MTTTPHEPASAPQLSPRALFFTTRREIETRPTFDGSALVTRDNYAGLVGQYSLPENDRVQCQLRRVHDRCNQVHGLGWLARTREGAEAYIGGACADKYFGAASSYARDRARATREIETDRRLARFAQYRADPDIATRLQAAIARLSGLHAAIQRLAGAIPQDIRSKLRELAKAGRTTVPVLVRYEEPAEDPKDPPRVRWVEDDAGPVLASSALDIDPLRAINNRVRKARKALATTDASRATPLRELRELVGAIDALPGVEADLERAIASFGSFSAPDNLARCTFLSRSDTSRWHMMRLAMGGPAIRRQAAQEAVRRARDKISARHGGRTFRVP